MTLTAFKHAMVGLLVLAGLAMPWFIQHRGQAKWQAAQAALREQSRRLVQWTAEHQRLSNLVQQVEPPLSEEQLKELLRLRNEFNGWRRQTNGLVQLRTENERLRGMLTSGQKPMSQMSETEQAEARAAETIDALKNMCLALPAALQGYLRDHTNLAPTSLAQLRRYFPTVDGQRFVGLYTFEFVSDAGPAGAPPNALILREQGERQNSNGKWTRVYAFGDGSVMEAVSDDENFEAWEREHGLAPSGAGPGR